jgi:hypothetical protein
VKRVPWFYFEELLMRPLFSAIALPILAASVLLVTGCEEANEGAHPDLKEPPPPGAKTSYSSYGEAMKDRAEKAAKEKAAGKDKTVKAAPAAPAKAPEEQPKP